MAEKRWQLRNEFRDAIPAGHELGSGGIELRN
jgi:hypothetical protein